MELCHPLKPEHAPVSKTKESRDSCWNPTPMVSKEKLKAIQQQELSNKTTHKRSKDYDQLRNISTIKA
jgi:hypothetical protein